MNLEEISISNPLYQLERELRNRVLLRPIGLPDHYWEMRDQQAWHFVAHENNEVFACLLLYPVAEEENTVQVMQMAVEPAYQGKGIGKQLLLKALCCAKNRGMKKAFCHARDNALGFYEKLDFNVFGEPFEEVGIKHFKMAHQLQ